LAFMRENGYYSANCPPSYNYSGGLAHYSMEVLLRMQRKNDTELPIDSIIIVALTHGMCYIPGFDSVRGDGARSALLISREAGFILNLMEYQAIQWHKQGREKKGKLGLYFDAVLNNQLWDLLRKAIAYCVKHPLNEEDLEYAMRAKPHRRTTKYQIPIERGFAKNICGDSGIRFSITREISEEEIHYREVRRNRVGLDDIFAATDNIDWTYQTTVLTDDYHKEQDNSGFRDNYIKEHPEDVEYHRTELGELCMDEKTNEVARYIYFNNETKKAFRTDKKKKHMHAWLKNEFGLKVGYSAFDKAIVILKRVENQKRGID